MAFDTITQTFTGEAAVGMRCWCSIQFAVPRSLYDFYLRKNEAQPGSFALHCPVGHTMVPAGRSEADRLRDELAREKHRTEQARADAMEQRRRAVAKDRQIAARKGQVTKLRKRIENGVCPCCTRHFRELEAHMKREHPDWRPEAELALVTPPDTLRTAGERRAWTAGAAALPGSVHAYGARGRGPHYGRLWQAGYDAARAAEQAIAEGLD